jgi:membrane protease YdiL (CAAX protease family)
MPDSPWFLATLAVISILSLRAWMGYLQALLKVPEPPPASNPMVCRYGVADIIFAAFLVLFFLLMILSDPGENAVVNRQVLINGMLFYTSLVIAMTSFLLLRGINPVEIFGLRPGGAETGPAAGTGSTAGRLENDSAPMVAAFPGSLSSALLSGMFWLAVGYPVLMLVQALSYLIAGADTAPQEILLFLLDEPALADRLAVLALAIVIAPLAEEFIFRGYLYGVARKYGGRWCAIGTTSLLFAAIHLHAPSFAGLFLLGCLLALLYERTRRLWVPVVAHMSFNTVSVILALCWPEILP